MNRFLARVFLGVFLSTVLFSLQVFAQVSIHGEAPVFEYPALQEKMNRIWQYEKSKYLSQFEIPDPQIYFYAFSREEESSDWVLWQNQWILKNPSIWMDWTKISGIKLPSEITVAWGLKNIERFFPFPQTFLAFHYDGTNKIQINPRRTFLPFYVNDPYGRKVDTTGFGFYNTAHELLHYTFDRLGIPGRIHHCLFITPRSQKQSLIEDATQFLIDQQISSEFVMYMGAQKENVLNPCGQLTKAELAEVAYFAERLP